MITYQWHRDHADDLFEFLELMRDSAFNFDLVPWGCRFTTVNAPYRKQVVIHVVDKDEEWRTLEIDYDDISELEPKIMEAMRKYQ